MTSRQQSFGDMTRNMTDELERRRLEWKHDVDKMQQDFFKMKLASPTTQQHKPSSSPASCDVTSGSSFQQLPDGSRVFRVRFDVHDYAPEELNVRVEDRKLLVSARHAGDRVSRQFSKSVDIPDEVDVDRLGSRLAFDGLLTVEAPLLSSPAPPTYGDVMTSPTRHLTGAGDASQWQSRTSGSPNKESSSSDAQQRTGEVIELADGSRILRVVVELSAGDYQPDDVQVVAYDGKLRVVARREVTSSSGVTSRREFSRELDVTSAFRRSTLRAVLDSGSPRRLWMAACVTSAAADGGQSAVSRVLPVDARPCTVQLR